MMIAIGHKENDSEEIVEGCKKVDIAQKHTNTQNRFKTKVV